MRLLIMGAPGAGKGTQAALIKNEYKIAHISTGDMFRYYMSNITPLGKEAHKYIDHGNLVPDELTIQMVYERLQEDDLANGFLLDGFPRNLNQAVALDDILKKLNIKLDCVLNITVDDNLLINRITGRRTCTKCGASYHVVSNKPKVEGICDVCGSTLVQRKDDTEETIKTRLDVYYKQTKPVLDYYEKTGIVKNVFGIGNIDEIFNNVKDVLGEIK